MVVGGMDAPLGWEDPRPVQVWKQIHTYANDDTMSSVQRRCRFGCCPALPAPITPAPPAENVENVYDYVLAENRKREMKLLDVSSVELQRQLGSGNFGAVYRGKYRFRDKNRATKEVPVAVKVLKCTGDSSTAEVSLQFRPGEIAVGLCV